jgi:hypothetical protein
MGLGSKALASGVDGLEVSPLGFLFLCPKTTALEAKRTSKAAKIVEK